MRVKCLAQEHNTVPWPRLEPGPLDPESSALNIRPLRLPAQQSIVGKLSVGVLEPRRRGEWVLGSIFGGYEPLASQSPFPIVVYTFCCQLQTPS